MLVIYGYMMGLQHIIIYIYILVGVFFRKTHLKNHGVSNSWDDKIPNGKS